MPHGTPDWGLVGPKSTTYGLDDLGEHAVRMGSPHFFDRRGDCLFLSDFREGLTIFDQFFSAAGGAVDLVTGNARTGAFCIMLTAPGGDEEYAELIARLVSPVSGRLGLEFSFADQDSNAHWDGYLDWWDGVLHHMGRVRISAPTGAIYYWDNASDWVLLGTIGALSGRTHPVHTLKFVVDQTLSEYVRVIVNNYLFSLVGTPVPTAGVVVAPYMQIEIRNTNIADGELPGYVDNVIVTQNEP